MRKIAIIGKCSNTRADAPLHDRSWEIWSLGWDPLPNCDRTFEMHANWRNFLGNPEDSEAHKRWLIGQRVPIYMLRKEDDIPTSVAFPMDAVADYCGRTYQGTPYLESSIAYMVALAIYERVDRIGIWGCDLSASTEYAYQRPNLEYLIGFAKGKGISVYTPPQSALLTHANGVQYGYWQAPAKAAA